MTRPPIVMTAVVGVRTDPQVHHVAWLAGRLLAESGGYQVVVIDLDPACRLSQLLVAPEVGAAAALPGGDNVGVLLEAWRKGEVGALPSPRGTLVKGLRLIHGSLRYEGIHEALRLGVEAWGWQRAPAPELRELIDGLAETDRVLLVAPGLEQAGQLALACADEALITFEADRWTLSDVEEVGRLLVRTRHGQPPLRLAATWWEAAPGKRAAEASHRAAAAHLRGLTSVLAELPRPGGGAFGSAKEAALRQALEAVFDAEVGVRTSLRSR